MAQTAELESGKPHDAEADTLAELQDALDAAQKLWTTLSERVSKRAGSEALTSGESAEFDTAVRTCEHKLRLALTAAQRKVRCHAGSLIGASAGCLWMLNW